MPVTVPDDEPIIAMPGREELHRPPLTPSVSVVFAPAHTFNVPLMVVGAEVTVTVVVETQPVEV
jgi:hypothetical protein